MVGACNRGYVLAPPTFGGRHPGPEKRKLSELRVMEPNSISVFLADDNLIVREGVKALLDLEDDFDIVGVAADYDELVSGAEAAQPQVVVTDIRMPPNFQREGIDAAIEIRKRHPGTGVVILSQYDDPEYAVSLLSQGSAGYAYLLKDRVGEGDQLARAVREVATGGSMLDPKIVDALTTPITEDAVLTRDEEGLLQQVAEGRPKPRIFRRIERLLVYAAMGVAVFVLEQIVLRAGQGSRKRASPSETISSSAIAQVSADLGRVDWFKATPQLTRRRHARWSTRVRRTDPRSADLEHSSNWSLLRQNR